METDLRIVRISKVDPYNTSVEDNHVNALQYPSCNPDLKPIENLWMKVGSKNIRGYERSLDQYSIRDL